MPSEVITRQKGQATANSVAPVLIASSTRLMLMRVPIFSSIHIRPPPAPDPAAASSGGAIVRPSILLPAGLSRPRSTDLADLAPHLFDPAVGTGLGTGELLSSEQAEDLLLFGIARPPAQDCLLDPVGEAFPEALVEIGLGDPVVIGIARRFPDRHHLGAVRLAVMQAGAPHLFVHGAGLIGTALHQGDGGVMAAAEARRAAAEVGGLHAGLAHYVYVRQFSASSQCLRDMACIDHSFRGQRTGKDYKEHPQYWFLHRIRSRRPCPDQGLSLFLGR